MLFAYSVMTRRRSSSLPEGITRPPLILLAPTPVVPDSREADFGRCLRRLLVLLDRLPPCKPLLLLRAGAVRDIAEDGRCCCLVPPRESVESRELSRELTREVRDLCALCGRRRCVLREEAAT